MPVNSLYGKILLPDLPTFLSDISRMAKMKYLRLIEYFLLYLIDEIYSHGGKGINITYLIIYCPKYTK